MRRRTDAAAPTNEEPSRWSEAGDTLIEVLIAVAVLGLAGVALLTGFATSISASANHRTLAAENASLRAAQAQVVSFVQQDASNAFACSQTAYTPPWVSTSPDYASWQNAMTSNNYNFTVGTYTVLYWNGQSFSNTQCTAGVPQQWTVNVTAGSVSTSFSTVITDTSVSPSSSGSCSSTVKGCQLVFLQAPTSGVLNGDISPQPIVAIEDGNGNIVFGDASSMTLEIYSYTGSATSPSLSSSCSGIENDGVVPFGDCSLNAIGSYKLEAVDSNSSVASAIMANAFNVTTAPPAELTINSKATTSVASSSATAGAIKVTEEDAYGNLTTTALTVNLGSTSSTGIFAATSGGAPITSVTIPAGSSSATFYYGDQTAGSPVISAASPGLLTATQTQTVTAGPPSQLAITSGVFTVAQGTSAVNPFSVALEDQYGNLATTTSATSVTLSSTSSTGIFSASSNGTTGTTVSIPKNTSSITAYYGDNTIGTPTIKASATGLTAAMQSENILAKPTKLIFSSSNSSGTASSATNIGPITVTEESVTSTPTVIAETVNLTSSSGAGLFSTQPGGTTVTSVSIPAGQSSATFYYGDTTAGTPTITGAVAGLTSAITQLTVTPAAMSGFTLAPSTTTPTAGIGFTVTIDAVDQFGNAEPSYTGTQTLAFSGPNTSPAPSSSAPSYPASVTFVNGVATGANAAAVTLYDAQTTTLSVSQVVGSSSYAGSSAPLTVAPTATTAFTMTTPSSPQVAGTAFTVGVTAVDQYDNTTTYGGSGTGTRECVIFSGPASSPSGTAPLYPTNHTSCPTTGQDAVTFGNGIGSASVTLYDAQTTTLSIAQAANTSITGTTGSFVVNGGTANALSIASIGSQTAGVAFNATLTATDQYGNAASGTQAMTFSGPASSPTPSSRAPSYPSTVTFTNGTGTANITLFDAQNTTLTARSTLGTATSSSFTVSAAATSKFSLPTPTSQVAGQSFNEAITAIDAYSNTVNSFTGAQALSFSGPANSPAPTSTAPSYPSTVTFANGVGTASITLYDAQTTTLTATQGSVAGSTGSFSVASGSPSALGIPGTPSTQNAGTAFLVGITALDAYGNPYSGSLTVSFSGPASSPAPLNKAPAYPVALSFSNGSVSASIALYDAQSTTLTVNATGATGATTGSFAVTPATENKLVVTTQPGSMTAGGTVTMAVAVQDPYDNQITTGNTGSTDTIGLTLNTGTFAGGTTSMAASNGAASFTTPKITKSSTFTITAADTTKTAVTSATTSSFTVSPAGESQLVVTTQPPATLTAGSSFSPGVTIEDQYGNVITTGNTGATDTVKLTLSSNSFASGTTSVLAGNGVAGFTNLQITKPGVYSIAAADTTNTSVTSATTSSFTVNPSTPSQLIISTQPASDITAGGTVSLGATLEDQFGNVVNTGTGSNDTVSVALSTGTFASGTTSMTATNGVANFTALKITNAGNLTITASDATRSVTTATTNQITVSPAAESKLVLTTQPVGVTAGGTITVGAAVEDTYGNVVTSGTGSTDTLKVTLSANSFASGTTSVAASNGAVSFNNLVVTKTSTYTINVSDTTNTGIASIATSSFTVSPAAASQLVYTTQPSNSTGGIAFPTQPALTVEDQYNNVVTTNASTATLAIASGTPSAGGPGTLSGCSQIETNGVITFSGCAINTSGTGYQLKGTDGTLTAPTSSNFNVTVGALAKFTLTGPTSPTAGTAFSSSITAQDAGGNTVTGTTGAQCLTFSGLSNSPSAATPTYPAKGSCSTGASSVTFASGVATGSNAPSIMPVDAQSTSLTATNSSSITGTSPSFTVSSASASKVTATSGAAQTSHDGAAFTSPLVATVTDSYGNTVPNALVTFTVPASSDAAFASSGCVSNSPTTVCTVNTGSTGQATSSTFTAGSITGTYNITASTGSPTASFAETNSMYATSVANATGAATAAVTSGSFATTSGTTYLITAYETSNQQNAPTTPTLTLPGSGASATLIATNTFSNGGNCYDDNWCDQWAWWFNAKSTTSSASVGVTFANGTPSGSVVDVLALTGNSTSTPIVTASTTTASGCIHGGCTPKTDTITANTGAAPAAGDLTLQILGSDEAMGTAPVWTPANTNLYFRSATDGSLDVNTASPGVQNEASNAAPFAGNDDWGTIALELGAN